ncbi:MAG: FtsX-like permease family protein [Patescibacteria group bacterium]
MRLMDVIRIAFSTFIHNKMRTLLTIFGVSVGIGTITFLLSIGYGLQKITVDEITSSKALKSINVVSGNSSILVLNQGAIDKLRDIKGVSSVDSNLIVSGQLNYGKSMTDIVANVVSARYTDLESLRLETGGIYKSDSDNKIIISSAVTNAFATKPSDFVGKKVIVYAYIPNPENDKEPTLVQKEYTVSGVIKDTSASYAYLPNGTVTLPDKTIFSAAKVDTTSANQMPKVRDQITQMGFKATSLGDKVDQVNQFFQIVNFILLAVGAIALFVASIGMFNTLTISLLERTRDIGIMKSLGATDREVYSIFLTESTIISGLGGLFGLGIALVLGYVVNILIGILATRAGGEAVALFQIPILFTSIIFVSSVTIGFLTGVYPAKRAAKLNPLDALRYE